MLPTMQLPPPSGHNGPMPYQLGDYVLDVAARRLDSPDGPVHVEPQVFDVLLALVERRDRAVAKEELLDTVWGDQFVSESALTSRIRAARAALGDDGRRQGVIRTVFGFGYQYVGPVEAPDETTSGNTSPTHQSPMEGEASVTVVQRSGGIPLPRFATAFRGRNDECSHLQQLLDRHRLVTVVGPGGAGKTRLAVEAATAAEPPVGDDLRRVFVDLTAITDSRDVGQLVADAVGIRAHDPHGVLEAVAAFVSTVPHLLVLDNCEHVVEGARDTATTISGAGEGVRVLATSRLPLGTPSEHIYRLGMLPVIGEGEHITPEQVEENPAAGLFVDRARQADHTFTLDDRRARQVVEVSRALDGLPLALELAAGRVATFGLDELVARLDRRLDVLTERGTARDERQRTLRSTIEWSYQSLDGDHQRLLRFLAVLPAGATLDQIEWMADELRCTTPGLDLAADLVDTSLLQRMSAPSGSRYVQLETLRAFGLEHLEGGEELDAALDLGARWVGRLVSDLTQGLRSPDEAVWVDRIQREFANIRTVRTHLVDTNQWGAALDLAVGLHSWARLRDAVEVWAWSEDLVDHHRRPGSGSDTAVALGRSLVLQAQGRWRRGDIDGSAAAAEEALALTDDPWTRGHALAELGPARLFSARFAEAIDCWTRSAELLDDAFSPCSAAIAAAYAGEHETAVSMLELGREVAQRRGNPSWLAWVAYTEAETALAAAASGGLDDDPAPSDDAIAALERAVELAGSVAAAFIVGVAKVTLAGAFAARGRRQQAGRTYHELIEHWLRSGSWTQMWTTLRRSAELLAEDDPVAALTILRSAADAEGSAVLAPDANATYVALERELTDRCGPVAPLRDRSAVAELARAALSEHFT